MVELTQEYYKYQTSSQQIASESNEKFILNKVGTDTKGNSLLIEIKDAMFPYKNFVDSTSLFSANMVKALFIETIKIVSKWYFIPSLLFVNKQEVIDAFNKIAFRIVSPKILKDRHWSKFATAFHFVIFAFLHRLGIEEKSADRFAEIFVFMIDMDNAYRLRIEDTFSATTREQLVKNPSKELKRLMKVISERDINPAVSKKVNKFVGLMSLSLLIPKIKKAFITTIQDCDYVNTSLDEGDIYWAIFRTDYNFLGLNYKQRQEYAKGRGWIYPKQMNEGVEWLKFPYYK